MNNNYGLENDDDIIETQNCWWGNANGPSAGSNSSDGVKIKGNVVYEKFSKTRISDAGASGNINVNSNSIGIGSLL